MKTIHILLCLLLVGGLLPVRAGNALAAEADSLTDGRQRKFDYYFLEAIRLKTLRQYDAAFDLLQHCLSIDPDAPSALYEVGQYYLYLKQDSLGVAALERAVRNAPDNYWMAQGLANLYMQQRQTAKAIALWQDMAARFSGKLDPLYNLLDLYNQERQYDKVISILDRLEQKTGKSEQVSMEKFRIYLQKGDNKKAFREIESLADEYPMELRYQVLLGDVYLQNGKEEKAYKLYRTVLDQEPDNAMAMYSMASYYDATGQDALYERQLDSLLLNKKVESVTKLAVMRELIAENERQGGDSLRIIHLFDRVMAQEPDDANLPMYYVSYLMSKGMEKETYPVLRQALDIDPANGAARFMLLGEAIKQEDYPTVIALCEGGIATTPDKLEYYFYLALSYAHEERHEEVLHVCRQAVDHAAPDTKKELLSDFYAIMGDTYLTLKQSPQGFAAYDTALVHNPGNIGVLNNYAYYLSLEGRDLDRAEEMSYKTVKAEPANATYLDTYAWILFMKGNYAEARIYIDDAMTSDEGKASEVIVEHCGDIYYMTGDTEGALRYWQQSLQMGNPSATLKQKIAQQKYIPNDETELSE